MKIDDEKMVSMSEANNNFSKVARMADEKGSAIILKNNAISYVVMPYKKIKEEEIFRDENVEDIAQRLIDRIKEEYNIQLKLDLD